MSILFHKTTGVIPLRKQSIFCLLATVLILLALNPIVRAAETPFNYDPDKIEPGTMYCYKLYTSSDATQPARKLFYYIRSSGRKSSTIEVLNLEFYDQGAAPYLNTYRMNWDKMMLESATWQYIGKRKNLPRGDVLHMETEVNFARGRADWNSKSIAKDGFDRKSVSTKFQIPTFFYFSNHVDGWTAMRFYPYQKEKIEVGVSNSFHTKDVRISYRGKETITVPEGEIRCHKFEIKGKGMLAWLFGKKAWLWMSAEDNKGYMVRYKNKNEWGHMAMMDLRLTSVEHVTPADWKRKVSRWSTGEVYED